MPRTHRVPVLRKTGEKITMDMTTKGGGEQVRLFVCLFAHCHVAGTRSCFNPRLSPRELPQSPSHNPIQPRDDGEISRCHENDGTLQSTPLQSTPPS
mmetsp:Transcript_30670/g.47067  ORF Transcript_30670/g.47067 Transcript_30670/m.47067 type:complete len:97 (+) Transcript_30670:3-293(+)